MTAKDWSGFAWVASLVLAFVLTIIAMAIWFGSDVTDPEGSWTSYVVWGLFGAVWVIFTTAEWMSSRTEGIKPGQGGKMALVWVLSFGMPVWAGWADRSAFLVVLVWLALGAPWVIPIIWKWLSGKEKPVGLESS